MNSAVEEKRQFLEDWGPFLLSGIPMLLAFVGAFSTISTRRLAIDPMIWFMAMAGILGLGWLSANMFGHRSVVALRLLAMLCIVVSIPAMFISGLTITGVARLSAIGVVWGMVSLIGRFKGFWWITQPLAKLNGYASMPEEWAKAWIAEKYTDDAMWENPELALELAKADWDEINQSGGAPRFRRRKRKGPSLGEKIWALIIDEPLEFPAPPPNQDDLTSRAQQAAATALEIDPSDASTEAFAIHHSHSDSAAKEPILGDAKFAAASNGIILSPTPLVESAANPNSRPGKSARSREQKELERLNEARLQAKL